MACLSSLDIKLEKFIASMEKIQSGYNKVTYHNKTHATDVAQTIYYFLMKGGDWMDKGKMENIDL
jgi:hypothetical protein